MCLNYHSVNVATSACLLWEWRHNFKSIGQHHHTYTVNEHSLCLPSHTHTHTHTHTLFYFSLSLFLPYPPSSPPPPSSLSPFLPLFLSPSLPLPPPFLSPLPSSPPLLSLPTTHTLYSDIYRDGRGICETLWGDSFFYSNYSQNDQDRQCMTFWWPDSQPNPNLVAIRNLFGDLVNTTQPAPCGASGLTNHILPLLSAAAISLTALLFYS